MTASKTEIKVIRSLAPTKYMDYHNDKRKYGRRQIFKTTFTSGDKLKILIRKLNRRGYKGWQLWTGGDWLGGQVGIVKYDFVPID